MDVLTPEQRHRCMQHNKPKDTKPEIILRRELRIAGFGGYRLHWKISGKPDIAYPGRKVAIFVNGCFWHRCPYCSPSIPKTHSNFWIKKFHDNVERDLRNYSVLQSEGWTVIVVWECQIEKNLPCVVNMICASVKK